MVNPDGYLFTQTDNRLWRKTRKPNGDTGCFGTDANRNFGYHWGTGGSSDNACSDTYMGEAAFSEVETSNMRDWLTAHNDTIKFYNNVHSYSQLVLLPWGFGYEEPDNVDDLYRVAQAGNDALYAVHQKTYEVIYLHQLSLRMLTLLTPRDHRHLHPGGLHPLPAVRGQWWILGLDTRRAGDPLQLRHGAARHRRVRLPPARGPNHPHRRGGVGLPYDGR